MVTPERPRAATTTAMVMPTTVKTLTASPVALRPPPYKPAPDYDTALKQPTIEEYRMMVSARQKQLIAAQSAGSSPEIHLMGVSLAANNIVHATKARVSIVTRFVLVFALFDSLVFISDLAALFDIRHKDSFKAP